MPLVLQHDRELGGLRPVEDGNEDLPEQVLSLAHWVEKILAIAPQSVRTDQHQRLAAGRLTFPVLLPNCSIGTSNLSISVTSRLVNGVPFG